MVFLDASCVPLDPSPFSVSPVPFPPFLPYHPHVICKMFRMISVGPQQSGISLFFWIFFCVGSCPQVDGYFFSPLDTYRSRLGSSWGGFFFYHCRPLWYFFLGFFRCHYHFIPTLYKLHPFPAGSAKTF